MENQTMRWHTAEYRDRPLSERIILMITWLVEHEGAEGFSIGLRDEAGILLDDIRAHGRGLNISPPDTEKLFQKIDYIEMVVRTYLYGTNLK